MSSRSLFLAGLVVAFLPLFSCAQTESPARQPAEEAVEEVVESTESASDVVRTELFVEYTTKAGSKMTLEKKQSLSREGSDRDFNKKYAASFELTTNKELPLQLILTNVWENLENRAVPLFSLPFDFQHRRIESGKLYVCPQIVNEQSGCRVQLVSARVDLGVSTEELICKLKVQTEGSLDFTKTDKILTVSAFPSSLYEDGREGKAFAMAFECSKRGQVLLKGHFLHNAAEIPAL